MSTVTKKQVDYFRGAILDELDVEVDSDGDYQLGRSGSYEYVSAQTLLEWAGDALGSERAFSAEGLGSTIVSVLKGMNVGFVHTKFKAIAKGGGELSIGVNTLAQRILDNGWGTHVGSSSDPAPEQQLTEDEMREISDALKAVGSGDLARKIDLRRLT